MNHLRQRHFNATGVSSDSLRDTLEELEKAMDLTEDYETTLRDMIFDIEYELEERDEADTGGR